MAFAMMQKMTIKEQRQHLLQIIHEQLITTWFQPIVSAFEKKVVGYEALSRGPSNSPLHSPLMLFAAARQHGMLAELDLVCRRSAIESFMSHGLDGKLFLNVSPESLLDQQHSPGQTLAILRENKLATERVVIELTEHSPVDNTALLYKALHYYRNMGFSMALDDMGAGYSSLRLWSELHPDFVKIDRHFIDGLHRDSVKREFVGSILNMARASDSHVIAEGIELSDELAVLIEMGVDWVQGYWLGRPQEVPAVDHAELQQKCLAQATTSAVDVGLQRLVIPLAAVGHRECVMDVVQRFQQQPSLNSLAVTDDDGYPLGLVHCNDLSQSLLKPYARELYGKKPVTQLLAPESLVVEVQQSLQSVSRLLTSRARLRLEEDFIITDKGRYLGLGRVIDVLRQITESQIRYAQSANPLTLLPGNVSIQECLERLLNNGLTAHVCYIDMDSFKPFNDVYGYGKGDEVLLGLARILRELCDPDCDFVGHIGGDDFMLVLRSQRWRKQLARLETDFRQMCARLYKPEHVQGGGFDAPDREGQWRHHDLLSLSIGVVAVPADARTRLDSARLAELASRAKYEAKKTRGFSMVVTGLENRRPDHPDLAAV